jgi:FG-GAP repeat/Calx-beta domain
VHRLGVLLPRACAALVPAFSLLGVTSPAWGAFSESAALRFDLPAGARFGSAVALGDGMMAVGAYLWSGPNGQRSGAVFLFGEDGHPIGSPFLGRSGEQLGWSLAFQDGRLLAGAPFAQVGGVRCGAVYQLDVTPAGLANPRLLNLPCEAGAEVGTAVAADGGLVAVGARGAAGRSGRIFLSVNDGGSFETRAPAGLAAGAELGTSVAVDSSPGAQRAVAGAPFDSAAGSSSGAVYAFERSAGAWQPIRLPASPRPDDAFGYAVAAGGGVIAVGAPLEDAGGRDAGAVYRYRRDASGSWSGERAPHGGAAGDQLGVSVALSAGRIVAGARRAHGHGVVYVLAAGGGEQALELTGPEAQPGAELGFAVAASPDTVVAGAFLEDQGPRLDTGAAYVFTEEPGGPQPLQTVTLAFPGAESTVAEGGEADVPILVTTSDGQPTAAALAVDLSVCLPSDHCTASAISDYVPPPSPLVVPAGSAGGELIHVRIVIPQDDVAEGDESFILHLSDPRPNGALGRSLASVTIRDDDTAGLRIEPQGTVETSEDQAVPPTTLTVALASRPADDVTVNLVSSDTTEGIIEQPPGAALTFPRDDWSTPQTVKVKGVDDSMCDGDRPYSITLTVTSVDLRYNFSRSLSAVNRDDDQGTFLISQELAESPDLTAVYTVTLSKACPALADDPGPEVTLELPGGAHLAWADADGGVVSLDFIGESVAWSGSLPTPEAVATIKLYCGLDQHDPGSLMVLP